MATLTHPSAVKPSQPSGSGHSAALTDAACVLAAWLVGYLLRLGITRMHVVTWWPEVAFIALCAVLTVVVLAWRGVYTAGTTAATRMTPLSLKAARHIALLVLAVGYGLSAVVRFLDVEIISRTAIVLAPVLSLVFMIGWRLGRAWWLNERVVHTDPLLHSTARQQSPATAEGADAIATHGAWAGLTRHTIRHLLIINDEQADLGPIWQYLTDASMSAAVQAAVYQKGSSVSPPSGRTQVRVLHARQQAYDHANSTADLVIAISQAHLEAWRLSPHYMARPGHRLVSIETLLERAQNRGYLSPVVH